MYLRFYCILKTCSLIVLIGATHSVAWTVPPSENHCVANHKPFCLDLHETTFGYLKIFLEKYATCFNPESSPKPFKTSDEHNRFILFTLKLLSTHLNLCINGNLNSSVICQHAKALRIVLFRYLSKFKDY